MTEILGQANLRRVFSAYPTGVAAVAALVADRPAGLAANSFVSVSLNPPLAAICIAHTSTTWPTLRTAARLGISVRGAHQEAAGRQLSARSGDRFAEVGWQATGQGAVLLRGATASDTLPLVFHGSSFRQLQLTRRGSECARTARPTAAPDWAAHSRHDRLDPAFGLAHPHA